MRSSIITYLASILIKLVITLKVIWICSFLFIMFDFFYNFNLKNKDIIYRLDVLLIYSIKICLALLIFLLLTKEGIYYLRNNSLPKTILSIISFILIIDAIVSHPYNKIFEKKFKNYNLEDLT